MGRIFKRPYITCSIAMSLDGYVDDLSGKRLILSNKADFKEIDKLRATQDAILIGAETLRRDNPKLLLKTSRSGLNNPRGLVSAKPKKVTITQSGKLKGSSNFFRKGRAEKIVYHSRVSSDSLTKRLSKVASLVEFPGKTATPKFVVSDLYKRGIRSLLIEGGEKIHTFFLRSGFVDEIRVAIAPFFVGEKGAPRFVSPDRYLMNNRNRFRLISVKRLKDMAILRYRAYGQSKPR